MGFGLLLVDLQRDFFARLGLQPDESTLVRNIQELLNFCRLCRIPVFHCITMVRADGSNRMPHWQTSDRQECLEGTTGADHHELLRPDEDEPVFGKSFFSAFGNPDLYQTLKAAGIDQIILAGLYTHACIRSTALDAYQAGFKVHIPTGCTGSCEPDHARISLEYLDQRLASTISLAKLQELMAPTPLPSRTPHPKHGWQQRNPSQWHEILSEVPISNEREVAAAVSSANKAQKDWQQVPPAEKGGYLQLWLERIEASKGQFLELLSLEIGKPRTDAVAEFAYGVSLLRHTIEEITAEGRQASGNNVLTRYLPHGTVATITPWNNPFAIPLGKLAPALAFGNSVAWKPALQAPAVARLIHKTASEAGLGETLALISGDAVTGQHLLRQPQISAVTFSGAIPAGRRIAQTCALARRPFQAELGGNNALVVMGDIDPDAVAGEIAKAIFSFSGQRCTAPRRIIIEQPLFARLEKALVAATLALKIGAPASADTRIGPVISRLKQLELLGLVQSAVHSGGRLLCGGKVPAEFPDGCWLEPTLIGSPPPNDPVVRQECFGPVAVTLAARDFDHALHLCNSVGHGLTAALYCGVPELQQRFLAEIEAGIISFNAARPNYSPSAPFLGWKDSGLGIPEHGRWDRDFYTRTQAVYGG